MTDHHLMPRYRQHASQWRALTNIILTTDDPLPITTRVHVSKLPGDPYALRGIPCLANGVGSTIRGTQPESATVRKLAA